jgi:hypothetical protein
MNRQRQQTLRAGLRFSVIGVVSCGFKFQLLSQGPQYCRKAKGQKEEKIPGFRCQVSGVRLFPMSTVVFRLRRKAMKTQTSFLLVLSWISVATVHAAQPSGNDISARVFNSTDVTVSSLKPGEWVSLSFDSERWDTANLHETASNSGRLKAPAAGKYYIFANITWESPIGSGLWGLRLQLNGKTIIAEQSLPNTAAPFRISMSVGTLYALAAGDYVEVQVFQNSGNPLLIRSIPATSPEFGMARVP